MITGYIKEVTIPQVAVGQTVRATIDFYAINPGALYWKSFLVVSSPGLGIQKVLDAAREIGQEGGRRATYSLGAMPNSEVAISVFLFAHDDAGYDWNWGEFAVWLDGFAVQVVHLASEYRFISPAPAPVVGGLQTLEVDIAPVGGGYVRTSPSPTDIANYWVNGTKGRFAYGTRVMVTAYANSGYRFEKWSDEIEGGVSYTNPASVAGTMTEHRAVKAHFRGVEEPTPTPTPTPGLDLKVLKYQILGDAGTSTMNFYPLALDDEGHYYKGEVVMLTAIPSSGYKFVKWRGEVDNQLSTLLTNTVTMSENRLVKAEFAKVPVPTPTPVPIPTPTPTPTPIIPVDWQKWLVPAALVVGAILVLSPKGKK